MIHPIIIQTEGDVNSLTFDRERLQKLLYKPKPVLWKRGDIYLWVPIEKVKSTIRIYKDTTEIIFPPPDRIHFVPDDCVLIAQIAGDVIVRYNGHHDD